MDFKKILQKQKNKILNFIQLQLFITLISLPILVAWGLPLSLLTVVGNFVFSPFLTIFLLVSSIIFFCQLLYIPNVLFIYLLQIITRAWLFCMKTVPNYCLVSFALPSPLLLALIPTAALAVLHHKKINTSTKGILAYSILLISAYSLLSLYAKTKDHVRDLECNNKKITTINYNNYTIVVDPGVIGRRISAPNWCQYTLIPHLAKSYGTSTIDYFIVLQPNKIIFDALLLLLEKNCINHIYLPSWKGKFPFAWYKSFKQLQSTCKEKNIGLTLLSTKEITQRIHNTSLFTLTPLHNTIANKDFEYPAFSFTSSIDKHQQAIYPAKHIPVVKEDNNGITQSNNGNCILRLSAH